LRRENYLADAGNDEGVTNSENHCQYQHRPKSDASLAKNATVVLHMCCSLEAWDETHDEVDELDADERGDDAAESVDEQIASEDSAR
jgi:hypothetical protein